MKRVKIKIYETALVYRKSKLTQVLTEGKYVVPFGATVEKYNMFNPFYSEMDLDILLQNEDLANALEVVEIADYEVALQFDKGRFINILTAGQYAYFKEVTNYTYKRLDLREVAVDESLDEILLANSKVNPYIRSFYVEAFQKAVLFIDGKKQKVVGPGRYNFIKNKTNIRFEAVDTRQKQLEISGQEILSADKANLRINFYVLYKVVDIDKAIGENKEYEKQLYVMAQLAIREYIGTLSIDQLMQRKEAINEYVLTSITAKAKDLGIEVSYAGIRDIILPGDVKEILSQVLIAEKKAQANIIMRREETASTRSLLNTAKLMEENTMLYKLKELEYVERMADKVNTISVSGGGKILEQMKEIFSSA